MKKNLIIVLLMLIVATAFSQKGNSGKTTGSSSSVKLTPQDSALILQQQVNLFIDSMVAKTSIKDMREFLFSTVTIKQYNEAKFSDLYDFFVRTKVEAWLQQKNPVKKPN